MKVEAVAEGPWFTTRSALFRPGDHVWNEVVRYESPLRALLARSYRGPAWGLDDADCDDLLQGILLEIKERLVESYDRSRGRFRALLRTVIHNKVVDHARRRPHADPAVLDSLPAPAPSDVEAIDLETSLLVAVSDCHDHFVAAADLEVVWILTDRLVHAHGNKAIAAKRGLTERQVAGRLTRARDMIFSSLLARELELEPGSGALEPAVAAFKACLRAPRQRTATAEELPPELRDAFQSFFERFLAALRLFHGSTSARYQELARGILSVFEERQPGLLLEEAG